MASEDIFRQPAGRWRLVAIAFIIISLILAIAVICLAVTFPRNPNPEQTSSQEETSRQEQIPKCDSDRANIDVSESDNPDVFHDLTPKELTAIHDFLKSNEQVNLAPPGQIAVHKSYIFTMDLYMPAKSAVLDFLDGNAPQPAREAQVTVFRGDASPPVVEEYIVGPLPNPSYIRLRNDPNRPSPIDFNVRPYYVVELIHVYFVLFPELQSKLAVLFDESYGAGFNLGECGNRCLTYYPTPIGTGVLGEKVRKFWINVQHNVEYMALHPLGMLILVSQDKTNPMLYHTEDIIYNGQRFSSVDELALKYSNGEVTKHNIPFPNATQDLFSTMHLRGEPVPETPKRPPTLFEPDGKRYNITHRYVEYMQWTFHFRMSLPAGPQLYDVRFNNERIAYEIGLQEIVVLYSGHNPAHMTSDFVDSVELLGSSSFGLVPGTDCPDTATFVHSHYWPEAAQEPTELLNVICIFEENSGFPLRRHAGYGTYQRNFYSGMLSSALVLRTALTIGNYDYIVDFVFHQNGALQIRTAATGYLFSSFYQPEERDYGFRLHDYIIGNMHNHLFNFKIDIDIRGTSNRYETLDISATEVPNDYSQLRNTYWQTKFTRTLKQTELEAAYRFDFKQPKYHVFHNNEVKTRHGEISGYRVHLDGMSYQPLPEDKGNEATVSWSRYQLATTKHKDVEQSSSSFYGMFDSLDPVVNFTSFLADNENITDEDLVIWATVGLHHIPHTEDLPVTPTTGGQLGIYLLPYNYFAECPSVSSRDAIRIETKDGTNPSNGVRIERYGNKNENTCVPGTVSDSDIEKTAQSSMEE